jgi:hypothetical protein
MLAKNDSAIYWAQQHVDHAKRHLDDVKKGYELKAEQLERAQEDYCKALSELKRAEENFNNLNIY